MKNRIDALLRKATKIQDRYQQKDCSQIINRFKQEHKETLQQHRQEQKRLRLDLNKPIDHLTFHVNFAQYTFFLFNSEELESQLLQPFSGLRHDIDRPKTRNKEKKSTRMDKSFYKKFDLELFY